MNSDTAREVNGRNELIDRPDNVQHNLRDRIVLGRRVPAADLQRITRTLNLQHAKWDTHVGDSSVLSPEPLLLAEAEWQWLCVKSEAATRELLMLEREIAGKKEIQDLIGLPRKLGKLLQENDFGRDVRTLRFDFHPTAHGWVLSEVNSDVPGGFGEASILPKLYEQYTDAIRLRDDPLKSWGEAIQAHSGGGTAALLCAPGFLEDEQVVRTFAKELFARGYRVHLIQTPYALRWKRGVASLRAAPATKIDLLVRFYQVEWLSDLPNWTGWKKVLKTQNTIVVTNSTLSAVSESKRLPLCWNRVSTPTDTLRQLLPECREPSEISGTRRGDWVLKAAYSNTGDEVYLGTDATAREWSSLLVKVRRERRGWVAQRRFETLSFRSSAGPLKPCVGVFVIGGKAAGAYVRLSRTQVTSGYALEAPLFLMRTTEDQ